ncbi:competence type IV pilus minor pilin ComGF [Streptococcus catagoni]|uniref:competence type IV pilus minor pilin ComGF n=1 Tax=Streptococcus catagoni TaxID=2654874 RepID=UPI00140D05D4|nr:competence type IV pilus minor pilin ComGF [Streptococcus catagoni]
MKRFLESKQSNLKAFTLLECLLALFIISGSLLVYQGLTKSLFSNIHYLHQNNQDRWLLFSHQLRAELEGADLYKVEGNKLQIIKEGKASIFTLSKKGDFRKMSANGRGYHPMLMNLAAAQIHSEGKEKIRIRIVWEDGMVRDFIYGF